MAMTLNAATVRLTNEQFAQLLAAVTKPVSEAANPAAAGPTVDLGVARQVDPVAADTLVQVRAGTPIHKLPAEQNEVVRLSWVADQFPRPRIR